MFLLLVLLRNPFVFAKAVCYLLILSVYHRAYSLYVVNHNTVWLESIGVGLGLERPSGVGFAYTAAHVIARIELYSASRAFALRGSTGRHLWRVLFGPVTPGDHELHELAAVANKITGYATVSELGVSAGQEALERALVFPHYLRCLLGLLVDALQGRTRGNESRIVVSLVAAIAVALFAFI